MPSRSVYDKSAMIATLAVVTFGLCAAEPREFGSSSETIDVWRMPPDAVVAKVDGEPVTAGHLVQHLQATPERLRPKSAAELGPVLERLGLERRLARAAQAVGLDKQQPYSTAVNTTRMQLLAKAQLEVLRAKMPVLDAEAQAWYEKHKSAYTSASVQIAYVRESPSAAANGQPSRTKLQAEAVAARLTADARTGKSFAQSIDAISDDHPLVTRKGTFRTFSATDVLPDELKQAILRGKAGEIVGPFAGSGGLFVCRIAGISHKALPDVREQVIEDVRESKLKDWIESQKRAVEIRELSN